MDIKKARELYKKDPYWPIKYQHKIRRRLGRIIELALKHGEIRIAEDLLEGKLTEKQALDLLRRHKEK